MGLLAWQDARKRARNVLDKHWDGVYPVRITAIGEAMGVTMYRERLPFGVSGLIVKEPGKDARAYAETSEPDVRRRFTYAHELGHFVERMELADDNDFSFKDERGEKYDLHEFYADEFAGALLMPEDDFLKMVDSGASLVDIAARFGVSVSAARKRRERLRQDPS